LQSS
jgi:menaquinone-dependent protoporphyrinogen oxidase